MASNSFGNFFKITTWGESHGKAIGVVIDGCPAGLPLNEADINQEMKKRAPGRNAFTTARHESDQAEILSGVFENQTTGAPISIIIYNHNADSSAYTPIKNLLRPGHANFTYQEKYRIYDYRGGGRASARETACRVAAGAVAKKILRHFNITTTAFLTAMGNSVASVPLNMTIEELNEKTLLSPLFCPHAEMEKNMQAILLQAKNAGDSLGGIIEFRTASLPIGLGDPIYEKLEANLAKAMLSLPATKGFEIGEGFVASTMQGSEHNDLFSEKNGRIKNLSNHAGGLLGGISTGMPLLGRVAFKPTSSIKLPQNTVDKDGKPAVLTLPENSRHDPCVAIRAVPIVDAMLALVLVDALLMNRCVTL